MTDQHLTTDGIGGGEVFAVDREARTIRGRAMPYGVVGTKGGIRYQFAKGSITWTDPKRVKLYIGHDQAQAVGHMLSLTDSDEGLDYVAKIARTPEGDKALQLADPDGDAVWDGNSIGPHEGVRFELRDGVHHAKHYPLREVSLTPQPVFDGARVAAVSMSHLNKEGSAMPESTVTEPETTEVVEGPSFDAAPIADAIRDAFANLTFPQREVTDPTTATPSFEVNEPSPYRFDGIPGEHSFSGDLRAYASGHDPEARQRIDTFMAEAWEAQFAVTAANVSAFNPTRNRPDLFVPNLNYTRPLWDLVSNGVVDDKTPFTIPKFSSASGLVGTHTEGVEPTPGAFTATSQTVTPAPVSGKVEIVREVWDQGGEPKADAIIWGEMLNGYFEAIEAAIATTLAAVPTAEINLASAVDSALITQMTNTLVDLQFVRGGNRFTALALDGMLGKALVNAADTTGRKILPVLGPTNAQGTTEPGFDGVQIGNLRGRSGCPSTWWSRRDWTR